LDRSSDEGAEKDGVCGEEVVWGETFLLFDLKMEHFSAVFKLDLTEETRTQLQEEEAIASYWLRYNCT